MKNIHLLNKDDKVYVSGGMTGYENENYPMFDEYTKVFREQGRTIFNPASDIKPMTADGKRYGIHEFLNEGLSHNEVWRGFLRGDILSIIMDCNSMYMTKGWLASKGARLERYIAKKFGYPIACERPLVIELLAAIPILFIQKVLKRKLKKPI